MLSTYMYEAKITIVTITATFNRVPKWNEW